MKFIICIIRWQSTVLCSVHSVTAVFQILERLNSHGKKIILSKASVKRKKKRAIALNTAD